jgi:peptidoglycan hydrolase CwlO-like protein
LQVAQLQKQKKKANKKASTATDTPKDTEVSQDAESTEDTATATEPPASVDASAEEKPEEDTSAEPAAPSSPAAENVSEAKQDAAVESPVEPMPPAPTSPGPEAEAQPAKLDAPRAGHTRQPSLSIQSKMRSSSFRKTSVSQGSVSPSPSSALKSPPQSLPPLTGDGESVHEVFRKQSTKIEELEKENKRLESEIADATARWRKTEEQVEDLREASVDSVELREKLKQAEEKVAGVESLVCSIHNPLEVRGYRPRGQHH